ncbi:VOC family protein [Corticibacterium sp. UT-5YL-CI-8]|nr:VOC family protein [Tianweitania sp. UT-5YL-CI-8]
MSESEPPRLFPTFRYNDAGAMIDWLVEAFGFEVRARYENGGVVQHAELSFGSAIIMVGSSRPDAYGETVGTANRTGGKSIYIAVKDADAAYAKAKAAGAEIVTELTDRPYGSREFICRDPEGNIWSLGTYWPKANEPA